MAALVPPGAGGDPYAVYVYIHIYIYIYIYRRFKPYILDCERPRALQVLEAAPEGLGGSEDATQPTEGEGGPSMHLPIALVVEYLLSYYIG